MGLSQYERRAQLWEQWSVERELIFGVSEKWASFVSVSSTGSVGLARWLHSEESACQYRRCRFDPWVGKIRWRRKWQPTPVFLPPYSRNFPQEGPGRLWFTGSKGTWLSMHDPPTKACLWFPVFRHVRIGGKQMWTWGSLGPAFFLQAQDQPSHIGKKAKTSCWHFELWNHRLLVDLSLQSKYSRHDAGFTQEQVLFVVPRKTIAQTEARLPGSEFQLLH